MSKFRIQRWNQTLALTHGAGANTVSVTSVPLNGILTQVQVDTPTTVDGSATLTINIIDSLGHTVYTKASLASSTKTTDLLTADKRVPLGDNYTVQIVFSANQTATDTSTVVTLMVDRG